MLGKDTSADVCGHIDTHRKPIYTIVLYPQAAKFLILAFLSHFPVFLNLHPLKKNGKTGILSADNVRKAPVISGQTQTLNPFQGGVLPSDGDHLQRKTAEKVGYNDCHD